MTVDTYFMHVDDMAWLCRCHVSLMHTPSKSNKNFFGKNFIPAVKHKQPLLSDDDIIGGW